jgi:hypothetical protein
LAERERINKRFQNPKFRRFVNITQLMLFSNNMEYEDGSPEPIQGAFYASSSYYQPVFNYFREEETLNLSNLLKASADAVENSILKDNNLEVIKNNPEFLSNKSADKPTNRLCTSLLSHDRLAFVLRYALASNFDQQDPNFVSLKEELERLFKKKNLSEVTQEEMNTNIGALDKIHEQVKELNRQNNQLKQKYQGDPKYTQLHKRLLEQAGFSGHERHIFEALSGIKHDIDELVLENSQIMNNESYFERLMMPLVIRQFNTQQDIKLNPDTARSINHLIVAEYLHEYNSGARAW